MEERKNFKAVLFDVDGTLYPQSFFNMCCIRFFLMHPFLSSTFCKLRRDIRELGDVEDLHLAQISLAAGYLRIPAERAERLIDVNVYGEYMDMLSKAKPYPQVLPLLESLKREGLKLGVISDYPVGKKLSALGLDRFWGVAISADDLGHLKPECDAFLLAAERLGVEPCEVLYVGNEYKYDIVGAKKAGMHAAHLAKSPHPGSIADFTFYDFNELRRYILGI